MNEEFVNGRIGVVDAKPEPMFVMYHVSLMENERLTQTEKNVYLALKSFAINCNNCYPTRARAMKRAGVKSATTFSNTVKSLEEKGVLISIPEFDENNTRVSNSYILARFDAEAGEFDSGSLVEYINKKKRAELIAEARGQYRRKGQKAHKGAVNG